MKKGQKMTTEGRRNVSLSLQKEKHPMWGKKFTKDRRSKISQALKGRIFSKETKKKMSLAKKGLYVGDKHPNWQGGITPINQKIKNSEEYKIWREAVFVRDNYTCIWCGVRSGKGKKVYLQADHIKPFSLYPELRFAIDNGRTLCIECHKTTDTYAGKIRHYIKLD